MNTIIIKLAIGQQIRQAKLNEAIKTAGFSVEGCRHNAQEVIVDCEAADEAAIRAIIDAHLATDWNALDAAEKVRADEAEAAIKQDAVIASIKGMTQAEYNAWWAANVTTAAQAIDVLKRLVRVICRRVL